MGNFRPPWTWSLLLVQLTAISASPFDPQGPKSYSGYSLVSTEPIHDEQLVKALLKELDARNGIHFWKYPRFDRSTDILSSPQQLQHIHQVLETLGLRHNITIQNVDTLLRDENTFKSLQDEDFLSDDIGQEGQGQRATSSSFFQRYQRYEAIKSFCKSLAAEDSRVTYETVGQSSEQREIFLVKISSGGNKPAIWIDGGMHAREWISPATAMFIMNKLVKDPSSRGLVDMFDFYIVPVINVDGYEWTHTGDRMWRKTRSRANGRCIGVDPNRNWGFHWAEQGSSTDPCSDIYHGPRAFSEPETAYVARAIQQRKNIKMYLTFHSYSQLWLVPYGYARGARPSDYSELVRMAQVGRNALQQTYGTSYRLGTAPDLLYPAAGGSDDWAKGGAGIKYSYCLELRDKGSYGFLLPANQIVPTGEETYNGLAAMSKELHRTLKKNGGLGHAYTNAEKELNSPSDN